MCVFQERRQANFFATRTKLLRVWEELEVEPEGTFGEMVAVGDTKTFVFSADNMEALNDFYQKVRYADWL